MGSCIKSCDGSNGSCGCGCGYGRRKSCVLAIILTLLAAVMGIVILFVLY